MNSLPVFDLDQVASTMVLDQLREGIIVTDENGAIRFVNAAARDMHGVAELDVEPENYSERYHLFTVSGEPHPFEDLPLARAVKGETVEDAAWIIRRPDGTEVYAVGSAKPLIADDGSQFGSVLTIRDETERQRARKDLRESEETVRAFFETAGIFTAVVDLVENDFLLSMGNARMAAVFGQERLSGQSGRALVGDEITKQIVQSLRKALGSEEPTIIEYPWSVLDEQRWYVATITPMRGSKSRLFLASLDITDRKNAERDLEAAIKVKDVLLHEVNHRVKNSLQMISSLLALQEHSGDPALKAALREARSRVNTVARVHERLYRTSAHNRIEIADHLKDLLSTVISSLSDDDNIEFVFSHTGEEVALGIDYAVPLALILVELAMNSVKYAFPGHARGTVKVDLTIDEDILILSVSDDGVGLKSGSPPKGSGMGRLIIEALATQIAAQTTYVEQDVGTGFRLTMPLPENRGV